MESLPAAPKQGELFDDENFVLVDDDGKPFNAAAETSALIALQIATGSMPPTPGTYDDNNGQPPGGGLFPLSEVETADWGEELGLVGNEELAANKAKAAAARDAQGDETIANTSFVEGVAREEEEDSSTSPSAGTTPHTMMTTTTNGGDIEVEDEDVWGNERTISNGEMLLAEDGMDEDWTLEAIVGKRKRKLTAEEVVALTTQGGGVVGGSASAAARDEIDSMNEIASSTAGGSPMTPSDQLKDKKKKKKKPSAYVVEYCCKWRWYSETTWESGEWLKEQGFEGEISTFELGAATQAMDDFSVKRKPSLSPHQQEVEDWFGGTETMLERVRTNFRRFHADVHSFTNIAKEEFVTRFEKKRREEPKYRIGLVFHGTNQKNVGAIIKNGLVVPGQDNNSVTVANGSVHGLGIYSSLDPQTPFYYSRNGQHMFVCAALIGPKVHKVHEWCVFFDSALILPIWVLRFSEESMLINNSLPLRVGPKFALSLPGQKTRYDALYQYQPPTGRPQHPLPPTMMDAEERHYEDDVGGGIPKQFRQKKITGKMIRQGPRYLKDLWKSIQGGGRSGGDNLVAK